MTATTRIARWASLVSLASLLAMAAADRATAQAVDLGALGINWNFETPDVDAVDNNVAEVTSTNNIGAGWNYTLLGGAAANYGVGDPIADTTRIGAAAAPFNQYCCYSATPNGGELPTPFEGRQIGFFNLPDTDSMAQIASIPVGSIQAGQTYELKIALGARATNDWADIHYAFGLATSGGAFMGTPATLTMMPDAGNTFNVQDVTYTLTPAQTASLVGQDATILIRANNGFTGGASPPDFVQANFDNVRLSGMFGAVNPVNAPALTIDRGTGGITLSKTGATNYNILGYSITSDTHGSLNQANWTKVSVAYDDSGNGSVDMDDDWTVLSAAGDPTDLSEAELEGGNGGVLATGTPINLGTPWIRTPLQDVQARLLLAGGTELVVPVTYSGTAIPAGDLNGNTMVNTGDWTIFKAGQSASFAGLSAAQRYQLGDLNNDGKQDLVDFSMFRTAYDALNGVGAFTAMVAGVPEPGSAMLLTLGVAAGLAHVRRRPSRRAGPKIAGRAAYRRLAGVAVAVVAATCSVSSATAQSLVAHWSFDSTTITTGANGILTAADMTGAHNATTQFGGTGGAGGPQINSVAGKFGQAADFANINANGQAQTNYAWMSFPQLTEMTGPAASDFSVSAWVKVPDQASWDSNTFLGDWGNSAAGTRRFTYWFSLANVDGNAGLRPRAQIRAANAPPDPATIDIIATTLSAAQAGTSGGATTFDDGMWRHLAFVWTEGTGQMKFYTDGVLRHTQTTAQPAGPNRDLLVSDSTVGALGAKRDNNRYFVGGMDETWVYNGALSDEQVLNLFNFNAILPVSLKLVIDQSNGQMIIRNDATNADPLAFSSYEISSASGGLDVASWTRIASQNVAGFPVGDGSGNGWEASAAASNNKLTEWYLQGESSLAPGAFVNLGSAYNETLDAGDLVFKYTSATGSVIEAPIVFESISPPSNPANFNGVGGVDGADLTVWRNNFPKSTASNKSMGDADLDSDTDGHDFLIWQRNVGAPGSVAAQSAVPEPSTVASLALAGVALAGCRPRRTSRPRAAVLAALATVTLAAGAEAAVTLDRDYRFGDDPLEVGSATFGSPVGSATFDSQGTSGDGSLNDLIPFLAGFGPNYENVGPTGLARPGAPANSHGMTFDGVEDYLTGLRLGFPGTSASSTYGGGPLNYKGISDRGFQLWVRPNSTGAVQSIVSDAGQHGLKINAAGNWVLRHNAADVASTKAVSFGAWTHVMVVRPYGATAPRGGSILYVNGEAVAASTGNYNTNDNVALAVGAGTGAALGTEFFSGTIDDLKMFVMGTTVDGVNRGTFNFGADNEYATQPFALGGLTGKAGDVNQDNALTTADVSAFVAGWGLPPNLVNGVQVGDIKTILKGDLNFDGATNLVDAGLLNAALDAAGLPALDVSTLPVPEPTALALAAPLAAFTAIARRRRRRPC